VKLILTKEVVGVGAPGDVVEVRDGYGRNFLMPRGFAMRWTRGSESQIATIRRTREVREVRDLGQARELAAALAGLQVRLSSRAGQGGRLFGSVTTADVTEAIKAAGGPAIDRRRVELATPIKTIGPHRVAVRLHPEVLAQVEVEVVAAS
jgi:large subunit ribosomal protein L9